MARPPGTLLVPAAIAALIAVAAPARSLTLTPPPKPVIDSAPASVRFKADPVIRGHLEGATPGTRIVLERAGSSGGFRRIAADAADGRLRVSFRLEDVRRTADYRLAYPDPVSGTVGRGRLERIRVRPRLSMKISPDNIFAGRRVTVSGRLEPAEPGRAVIVQRWVEGDWHRIKRAHAGGGRYRARLRSGPAGGHRLRVRFAGDEDNLAARRAGRMRVYRSDLATWYGPGFYGRRTACGQTLGYATLGVAHRHLPCGTPVGLLYGGRTVTVRVIDRGPFSAAEWDLTGATARRLGFSGTDRVGVVRRGS